MASIQPVGKTRGHVLKQIKTAQPIIPDDGFADGGMPYDNEEMDIIEQEERGRRVKSLLAFYDGGGSLSIRPPKSMEELEIHLSSQQQTILREMFGFDSQEDTSGLGLDEHEHGLDAHGLPPNATQHDIWNSSGPDPTEDPHLRQ